MKKVVLRVRDLRKWYMVRKGFTDNLLRTRGEYVRAVDGVDLDILAGEIVGLVGESGSGKTTLSKLILKLIEPTGGKVYFNDYDIFSLRDRNALKMLRRDMQMIFQDPYEYLSPRLTVGEILAEPLTIHRIPRDSKDESRIIKNALESVGLTPTGAFVSKYPHELSGGQRQRVVIARALILGPRFIVCDEPVSMIDVSIRLDILNLLSDLSKERGLTLLFITHDVSVARYLCGRIAIMYLGRIVEDGSADHVVTEPLHPYARALISAVPTVKGGHGCPPIKIKGTPDISSAVPFGCRFHPRCPLAEELCRRQEPQLVEARRGHMVACHLASK